MAKQQQDVDDKGNAGNDDLATKLKQVTDAIVVLTNNQKNLQDSIAGINQNISSLKDLSASQMRHADDEEGEDNMRLDDKELENLSRKDFMEVIMGQFSKQLDSFGKGLDEKIGSVKSHVESNDTKAEFDAVMAKYKDFGDWAPEIKKLIEETPNLSLERAYKIARAEGPDKAKELDEKYVDPNDKGSTDKGGNRTGFGGLTPTSGAQTDKPTDMSQPEAAEAAWAETMEGLEGLIDGS